jgi:membrane protein DedA with SNARE-associated domain
MAETFEFLIRHGYALLFAVVLAEQLGLPVPAAPVLMAMGALAGLSKFSFWVALAVAAAAALLSDSIWYEIGRRRGRGVLTLLCRISIEPDSCVRQTEDVFVRYGSSTLLFAKFVPGLSTIAPPLAGMTGMRVRTFALLDAAGSVIWAGALLGAGLLFRHQVEPILAAASSLGLYFVLLAAAGLAVYLGIKYYQRWRIMKLLRISRISASELNELIVSGAPIVIVDMRNPREIAETHTIPGAIRMRGSELELRHGEIARDRDVILYCS